MEEKTLRQILDEESSKPRPEGFVPIWKKIEGLMADVPDEVLAKLPTDGAENHDHYLYGWPKREKEGDK